MTLTDKIIETADRYAATAREHYKNVAILEHDLARTTDERKRATILGVLRLQRSIADECADRALYWNDRAKRRKARGWH